MVVRFGNQGVETLAKIKISMGNWNEGESP